MSIETDRDPLPLDSLFNLVQLEVNKQLDIAYKEVSLLYSLINFFEKGLIDNLKSIISTFKNTIKQIKINRLFYISAQQAYKIGALSATNDYPGEGPEFSRSDYEFLHFALINSKELFNRNFNDTTNRLYRFFDNALRNKISFEELEKRLIKHFDYSRDRADKIIKTELVRIATEARINQYDRLGVEELEYRTARDERTCAQCEPMDGRRFKIKDAHGIIPLHPRCRCLWIPVRK